jgi:prepilin-type N-terminal cleavage/methylation domain-containing protein
MNVYRARHGFTLIELLVVIAIIGSGLGCPVLDQVPPGPMAP